MSYASRVSAATKLGLALCLVLGCASAVAEDSPLAETGEELAPLREIMSEELAKHEFPSIAVTVMRGRKVIFDDAIGLADRENGITATTDTTYSLASVSKIFTGAAIMVLVEQGKVDLDLPIDEYLGEEKIRVYVGSSEEVTVRRVAEHTAGLANHYNFYYEDQPVRRPPMDQSIRMFARVLLPPGERFHYSNFGYGLLDYVVERLSGKSYSRFLQDTFFNPLSMPDSGTFPDVDVLPRVAVPYGSNNQRLTSYDFDTRGASAVFASTRDLARFGAWFMDMESPAAQAILSTQGRREMVAVEPAPESDGESTYGLGINVRRAGGELIYSHSGNMPGVTASLTMVPKHGVAVAVAINSSVPGSRASLAWVIDAAIALAKGQGLPKPPEGVQDSADRNDGTHDAIPEELHGRWLGSVTTLSGTVPLQLNISGDGTLNAIVDGGELQPVEFHGVVDGMFRFNLPTIEIDSPEARRHSHRTLLSLVYRGERLNGGATAFAAPELEFMGGPLSYWVDLGRLPYESD